MENNGIVKWLAITLIAILGINVYRTETTKKEMTQLVTTVEQLSAKLDSLEGVSPSGRANASGISKREFSSLSRTVASLETKVSSLQGSDFPACPGFSEKCWAYRQKTNFPSPFV